MKMADTSVNARNADSSSRAIRGEWSAESATSVLPSAVRCPGASARRMPNKRSESNVKPIQHQKCRRVGVTSTALLALFFSMGVSMANESEHIFGDIDGGSPVRKSVAVPCSCVGIVPDQGIPESLKSSPVPKKEYARLIFETGINNNVISAVENLEGIGFLVESITKINENRTELVLGIPARLDCPNKQGGSDSQKRSNQGGNQVAERVVHKEKIELGIPIGLTLGCLLAFCLWGAFRWIDARCFDLLQWWERKK